MKRRKVLIPLIVVLMFLLTATAQASKSEPFYLAKACPHPGTTDTCDIIAADPFGILVGGQIVYTDHAYFANPTERLFESATIHVTTGDGTGEVVGHIRWHVDSGKFTLGPGTGSLAGLHANGTIVFEGAYPGYDGWFSLAGTYHVDPQP